MTSAAVASAVHHTLFGVIGDGELSCFVFIERPEVVFLIEIGLTAFRIILLELLVAGRKQAAVLLRRHTRFKVAAARHITGEGKNICARFDHRIDNSRDLAHIGFGNRRHDHRTDTRFIDTFYLFERAVVGAGLTEPIVRVTQAVERELILFTAEPLQFPAHLVVEVERIAEDRELNVVIVKLLFQLL